MTDNVFLFVPNLIDYGRIILTIISFYYMPSNHYIASWAYILSGFLDVFDGHAARIFNQGTKIGAMLDQLTDRCGTAGLLLVLGNFYPRYIFFFQVSTIIDISCHWLYLHTSIVTGKTSHKDMDANTTSILQIYYSNKPVLVTMCLGNEGFYCMLYLLHFTEGPMFLGLGLFRALCWISFPIAMMKLVLALMQGHSAAITLGQYDCQKRSVEAKAK